jgi:hypothetical protein
MGAFGLQQTQANEITPIIKYDARAGRIFKQDYNFDTREKVSTDITTPPPKFAMDFGSLEVGYIKYTATGPDYKTVPEGSAIPVQPDERDDSNRLLYRAGFLVKIYGKVLDGLREWSSSANCALEAVDDLYNKFREAPEAHAGKIPIVELTRTLPVTNGRGAKSNTTYAPCFAIVGWTDRNTDMGARTVPPPGPASAPDMRINTAPPAPANPLNDEIPF